MNIFTKRNAVVGYVALRVLDRRLRMRSGSKLGLYVALGLISFGILAAVAAVALRRRGGTAEGPVEDSATEDEAESDEAESEIVGEYVAAAPEPIPTT
jgi:hypothetical protein